MLEREAAISTGPSEKTAEWRHRLQELTALWLGLKLNLGLSSSSSAAKTVTVRRAGAACHCLHCTDCPASCRLPMTGVDICMHTGCSIDHSSTLAWLHEANKHAPVLRPWRVAWC